MFPVPNGGNIHKMLPWGERKNNTGICQIIEINDINPDNNEFKTLCGNYTFADFTEIFLAEPDEMIYIDLCSKCSVIKDAEKIIKSI